jgi:hypothetical protein
MVYEEYGHRKGHGNRWDHDIDGIILDYMLERYEHCNVEDQIWGYPRRRRYIVKHTQSELAKVVRDHKGKGVSMDTIIAHLNTLVEEYVDVGSREVKVHVIERHPERGRNNEIYYSLMDVRRFGPRFRIVLRHPPGFFTFHRKPGQR